MAVLNRTASFYETASDDFFDDLVNKELESMQLNSDDLENDDINKSGHNSPYINIQHVGPKSNNDNKTLDETIFDEDSENEHDESKRIVESVWSVYNERVNEFYDLVENQIIESEKIMKEVPSLYSTGFSLLLSLSSNIIIWSALDTADKVLYQIHDRIASEMDESIEVVQNIIDEVEKFDEKIETISENKNPDEGITNEIIDVNKIDDIEREFLLEIKKFEENQRKNEELLKREEEERRKAIEYENQQSELKWKQIQEKMQLEKELIESKKRQIEEQHNKMMQDQQRCIDRNLEILKINLDDFTNKFEKEKENLKKFESEVKENENNRRLKAAVLIQKHFRGYIVRKRFGIELKNRVQYKLEKIEQRKIFEIEIEQQYQEEKRAKMEEEKKRKLELELRRLKDQQEYELEMEKVRLRQIEEEKERVEKEKQKLLELEMSYKKCLNNINEEEIITNRDEVKQVEVIEESYNLAVESTPVQEVIQEVKDNKQVMINETEISNEENNEINKKIEVQEFVFKLHDDELLVFNEWRKSSLNNLFDNIKHEHINKLQQLETSNNINDSKRMLKTRPRSSGKKRVQNIPDSLLLKKSNKNKLNEINILCFQALTSYSLSTLELCTNLAFLTLINSQITTLDGLQNCSNLKYINAQSNKIEWIDLRNLPQLIYLNLSNNNLSSIQNLTNCNNLRYLNISQNKLTRLGFLNPNFFKLQYLNVSNNQLISTIGLSNCISLQFIDLSSNNLNSIEDLDTLTLLIELNGSKNNLLQMPDIVNQILLTSLKLNDNSILTLNELSKYWMPLLTDIELNQNRISEIQSLNGLFIIDNIKLENNDLCDLKSVEQVDTHLSLNIIYLTNNPIINEENINLNNFNFEAQNDEIVVLKRKQNSKQQMTENESNTFKLYEHLIFINRRINEFKHKISTYVSLFHKISTGQFNERNLILDLNNFAAEFDRLNDFIIKLRYIIESNDLNFIFNLNLNDFDQQFESYEVERQPLRPQSQRHNFTKRISSARLERIRSSLEQRVLPVLSPLEEYQMYLTHKYTKEDLNKYATKIQSQWKGYKTRKQMDRQAANMAAIIIQSKWRGYIIRKRLKDAKNKLRNELDDFNEFEEIDLKQFDFDETKFDLKLAPLPPVMKLMNNLNQKPPRAPLQLPPIVQHEQKKAWKNSIDFTSRTNSPINQTESFLSSYRTPAPDSEAVLISNNKNKHEIILNEWGFKDERTAQLMLQRADKMKYRGERKNKLKSLDPKQRLKLLRKFDKFTPRLITTPSESRLEQKSVLHYSNDMSISNSTIINNHQNFKQPVIRTYEWLHSVREFAPSPPIPPPNKITQIPKLPHLKNSNSPGLNIINSNRNNIAIASNVKPMGSKAQVLPPFNNHSRGSAENNDFEFSDTNSLSSSRSSFTQMFLNTKSQNLKKNNSKKRKMT